MPITANYDNHNRFRSRMIAFRVSDEEKALIDKFAELSGLNKQDYCTSRLLQKEIVIRGTPRVYKALKTNMMQVCEKLDKLTSLDEIDEELKGTIKLIAIIYAGMKEGKAGVAND